MRVSPLETTKVDVIAKCSCVPTVDARDKGEIPVLERTEQDS